VKLVKLAGTEGGATQKRVYSDLASVERCGSQVFECAVSSADGESQASGTWGGIGVVFRIIDDAQPDSLTWFERLLGCRQLNIVMGCRRVDIAVLFVGGYLTTSFL
jgi:hypothetical protein